MNNAFYESIKQVDNATFNDHFLIKSAFVDSDFSEFQKPEFMKLSCFDGFMNGN